MAQKVNVNRNVQDPFYRYKMPRIVAKVEGKGNGIKTVIANMNDVAKALSRPPTYPTKYFGCELGAQTNFDLKNDRYIVNGEHDENKLQDLLDVFIKKFVLCESCENPETVLTVKKQAIYAKCKACGHKYQIDPKQKLSTFIVKNPPTPQETGEAEKDVKKNENSNSPTEEIEEDLPSDINNSSGRMNGSNKEVEDDDWAPELDLEAEKLSGEMGKMVVDKDLERSTEERLDMLHQFFLKAKENGTIQDGKKMLNEAERLELKCKAPLLLSAVLLTKNVVAELKQYRNLLLRFCINDNKAQRCLLGGIEQLVYKHKDMLLPKTAHIIKALYDNDLCDEDVLLSWDTKPSGRFIKKDFVKEMNKVAKPFINWLKEAEEDSESEEEVAVAFDDRTRNVGTVIIEKEKPSNATNNEGNKENGANKESDNDDIDIDNI